MTYRYVGIATGLACCAVVALASPAFAQIHPSGRDADEILRSSPKASFLPGVPGLHLGDGGTPGAAAGVDESLIIKMTYRAVSTAARRSGHELQFDLSDFKTHYRDEFPHLFLSDLMSVAPMTLAIEYTEVANRDLGQDNLLGAAYEPAWETPKGGSERTLEEWGGSMTYGEILRMAASDPENQTDDPNDVVAVTTYKVLATFQEQSANYRAMFVWLADEDGATRFLPQDYVTQRVDEIWQLSQQAAPIESLLRGEPAPSVPNSEIERQLDEQN